MKLMEEIEELKEYKEDKNLPIAELARRIEADDTTVGRWLKGGVMPSEYSLLKVRRFLDSVKGWEGSKTLDSCKGKVTREHERAKKDINYLKQRIKALNDIEELDPLVDELNTITQLGKLMLDAYNTTF